MKRNEITLYNIAEYIQQEKKRIVDKFESTKKIASVECPILIIHGNCDYQISPFHVYLFLFRLQLCF